MRKPLMVAASVAVAAVSLAGCKLDVTPVDDKPAAEAATTINGDGQTIFSEVKTQLGTYRSAGSLTAGEACEWQLFEDDNNDAGDEQQVRLEGDNFVADGTIDADPSTPGVQDDTGTADDVDADEDQVFKLQAGDARLVAEGCKTFVRIGD